MADRKGRDAVAARASQEHEAIVRAAEALERALASPAPGRERAWRRRARAELAVVVDSINRHISSAESAGGVLSEVELSLGRTREVTAAQREHGRIAALAENLMRALNGEGKQAPSYRRLRRLGLDLTSALRRHMALEADLVLAALEHDIGVGD